MSYSLIKTITVRGHHLIESTDLSKTLGSFSHTESYIVVQRNLRPRVLDLGALANQLPFSTLTASLQSFLPPLLTDQFVERYAVHHIPVQNGSATYDKRLVVFNPLAYKNYQVHFTSVNTPEIVDDVSKKGFLDDLVILSDQDMSQYLVAVNGVFHRTVFQEGKLYVLDGFRTMRVSGRKDITVVDTKDIGGHSIVPLTPANVTHSPYLKPATITLEQSIQGKTVLPVIDGYFYHMKYEVLGVIDAQHLLLHTNKLLLTQQFRHNPRTMRRLDLYGDDAKQTSRKYHDDYSGIFLEDKIYPVAALQTADFQYSRLTTFHSFLVVFNNAHLYPVEVDVLATGTPQFYEDPAERVLSGMLNYNCGLCPSYLLWRDVYGRKTILLSDQDTDVDWQDHSIAPQYVTSLIKENDTQVNLPAQFIDYVSA